MEESAREGLLVDGAGAPLAEEDSGSVELLDGTSVAYHAISPENASAPQRFHPRLSERSIYLRFFATKPELSPGARILSTKMGGGTTTMGGTSMAAPHVGGGGALYLSSHTGANSSSVEAALKSAATRPGTTSKDGR